MAECREITDEQRAALATLREPGRRWWTREEARCRDGEFSAPIEGLAGDIGAATRQLTEVGWQLETDDVAFHLQLWRRCFRDIEPGWEQVQITIDATRGGAVPSVRAIAPENADACELERRETSDIHPPRDRAPLSAD